MIGYKKLIFIIFVYIKYSKYLIQMNHKIESCKHENTCVNTKVILIGTRPVREHIKSCKKCGKIIAYWQEKLRKNYFEMHYILQQ